MFVNLRASDGAYLSLTNKNDLLEATRKIWAEAIQSRLSLSRNLASLGKKLRMPERAPILERIRYLFVL